MRKARPSSFLVNGYVVLVVVLAMGAFAISLRFDPSLLAEKQPTITGVLAFVAIGLALDLTQQRLALGLGGTSSLSFIVFLSAAMVFGPTWCAGISAVTVGASQVLIRKPPIRIAFNVAQTIVGVFGASSVYLFLGGVIPPSDLRASLIPFIGLVV